MLGALGNPGEIYAHTYHNVGFLAQDALLTSRAAHEYTTAPPWKKYKKLYLAASYDSFVCIRPLTYMNESGLAIKEALRQHKLEPEQLILFHDDSDLMLGSYKVSYGKNSGGHQGVQSVIDALHTNAFTRIRIGIRNPREIRRAKAGDFALRHISPSHQKILRHTFQEIILREKELMGEMST